jgi:hypothetical protein
MSTLLPVVMHDSFTTLHMAANLSLTVICSKLLDQGASIDRQSGFGSPLECAVRGVEIRSNSWQNGRPWWFLSSYFTPDQEDLSKSSTEDTVRAMLRRNESRLGVFNGQALVTAALSVACLTKNLGVTTVLLEAGFGVNETSLAKFDGLKFNLLEEEHNTNDDNARRLETLVLCLGPMINKSAGHFRLCQAVRSLAVDLGCAFTRDPSVVDADISLSKDALIRTLLSSIRLADVETLTRALMDPRANTRMTGLAEDGNIVFVKNTLPVFKEVSHVAGMEVIKILLAAGMEVKEPDHQGLLPIHGLAKYSPGEYDNGSYAALCEVVREFISKGTGCNVQSRDNQNILHLGLHSISFVKAVLETETKDNMLAALRGRNEDGYTPIILALQAG